MEAAAWTWKGCCAATAAAIAPSFPPAAATRRSLLVTSASSQPAASSALVAALIRWVPLYGGELAPVGSDADAQLGDCSVDGHVGEQSVGLRWSACVPPRRNLQTETATDCPATGQSPVPPPSWHEDWRQPVFLCDRWLKGTSTIRVYKSWRVGLHSLRQVRCCE